MFAEARQSTHDAVVSLPYSGHRFTLCMPPITCTEIKAHHYTVTVRIFYRVLLCVAGY